MDTDIHENAPRIREITSRLYVGDGEMRLAQEVLLGIGGMRALAALDLFPKVCHLNEGHSAFSAIERLAQIMNTWQVDLDTALEIVPRATVFTTHTPVAAGHDEFPVDQVGPYLKPFEASLGVSTEKILSWGQPEDADPHAPFSMFLLALQMAQYCNGVSELHGKVARKMWNPVWPTRSADEVPISHVTNGVHIPSYISLEFVHIFQKYLGPDWVLNFRKPEMVQRIEEIYDEELWRAHETNRARVIRACRQRMKRQYERRNAPLAVIEAAESVLDSDVLTIGFARRFATYKRANLLLQDPDRLEAIINSEKYPVQFIFAGKAHPRDDEGKELIRRLVEFSRRPSVRHRFVFLEDYDMGLARYLVQGVDVWLNTPRRPYEACGTSGIKAAANGVLNVSILDGWWCEGYSESVGWAIGHGEEYSDPAYQDAVESQALYNVLENDVIPCFYERRNGEAPHCWMKKLKASMIMAMEQYCSVRMVSDYRDRFYFPAAHRMDELANNDAALSRLLAKQAKRLLSLWHHIRIESPARDRKGPFRVGDAFRVTTTVSLGELKPEEIAVELFYGPVKSGDALESSKTRAMTVDTDLGEGRYRYHCDVSCPLSGRYGFTARVVPHGDERVTFTPQLITWA